MMCVSITLSGQSLSSKQNEKQRLEKEIAQIDKMLATNKDKNRNALNDLSLVQKKVANRKALVAESDRQIKDIEKSITATKREVAGLSARLDTLREHYNRLVLSAYRNRDANLWYAYIFSSESLSQAFRRYSYFRNISEGINVQAQQIKIAQRDLESKQAVLLNLKDEASHARAERAAELKKLQKEESQYKAKVEALKKDRRKYEKQLKDKQKQVERLNSEIKKLIASGSKTGSSGGKTTQRKNVDYKLNSEFESNKGKLPWPAEGPLTEQFGQRFHPVFTYIKLPPSNGISIATADGADVKAVFDGVVSKIVVMPGFNDCILVQHGNYYTFYGKLKAVKVKVGEKVSTSQVIGSVDTISGTTELHFQVWYQETPQDPMLWLRDL